MGIEIVYVIGAVVFLGALIYGVNGRRRTAAQTQAGDAATRRMYGKK